MAWEEIALVLGVYETDAIKMFVTFHEELALAHRDPMARLILRWYEYVDTHAPGLPRRLVMVKLRKLVKQVCHARFDKLNKDQIKDVMAYLDEEAVEIVLPRGKAWAPLRAFPTGDNVGG
jgi:hypothetical protein